MKTLLKVSLNSDMMAFMLHFDTYGVEYSVSKCDTSDIEANLPKHVYYISVTQAHFFV